MHGFQITRPQPKRSKSDGIKFHFRFSILQRGINLVGSSSAPKHHLYASIPYANLLSNSQEEPITHITQSWHNHPLLIQLLVHTSQPDLRSLGPLLTSQQDTRKGTKNCNYNYPLDAPFLQCLDRGDAGSSCGNDWVEDECYLGCRGVRAVGGGGERRDVVGKVVIVFNRREGCGFAEETEVVDWCGDGKEGLNCCEGGRSLGL